MRIAGEYSFNRGKEEITRHHPDLLSEVNAAIKAVDATRHKVKTSNEKTMRGKLLCMTRSTHEPSSPTGTAPPA